MAEKTLAQLEAEVMDEFNGVAQEQDDMTDLDGDQTYEDQDETESDDQIDGEDHVEEVETRNSKESKSVKKLLAERNQARDEAKLKDERIAELEARLPNQQEDEEITFEELAERTARKIIAEERSKLDQEKALDNVLKEFNADEYRNDINKYITDFKVSPKDAAIVILAQKNPQLLLNGFDEGTRNRISSPKNTISGNAKQVSKDPLARQRQLEEELVKSMR